MSSDDLDSRESRDPGAQPADNSTPEESAGSSPDEPSEDPRESGVADTGAADASVGDTGAAGPDAGADASGGEDSPQDDPPAGDSPAGETAPETAASEGEPAAGSETAAGEEPDTGGDPDAGTDRTETGEASDASSEISSGTSSETSGKTSSGTVSASSDYYDDPYDEYEYNYEEPSKPATPPAQSASPPPPPPPPPPGDDEEEEEDGGMLRMSFLNHLEELRTRIIRALMGLVIAYALALIFKNELFRLMRLPFDAAVRTIHETSGDLIIQLVALTPMEQFNLIWMKVPIVAAIFLAAPWWIYQVWGFISPGLYSKERRWATPFILCSSGLFILGGLFGYFVALQFALAFLLQVGSGEGVAPMISISSYYGIFVSILLGLGVVFQMPIVIFILTVLRISSPRFLLDNVRYAILIIFVLAAVITPTPDVFNMILFAGPMVLLFYVGIIASYLFVMKREGRTLPWNKILIGAGVLLLLAGAGMYYMHSQLGYRFVTEFPWFGRP